MHLKTNSNHKDVEKVYFFDLQLEKVSLVPTIRRCELNPAIKLQREKMPVYTKT